jgi:ATP-binding cassette subfamily C (CFTR/MRP) protein 4
MQRAINDSMRANNSFWFASRVFGVYITYVSVLIASIGIFVGIKTATDPGIYGVAIVFILQLVDFIQWLLRQMITMESIMVSVERAFLIAHLPNEGPLRTDYDETIGFKAEIEAEKNEEENVPKTDWPKEATIELRNFTMRYRKDFNPVLKQLNFLIKHGEKVGIVGRTGAGKSSIIQAVFRMVPGDEGSLMYIGGCDALSMGLHSLRKNISIIPQTPFLFKGSIK